MRKVVDSQLKFGEVNIAEIEFDLRSRDEIPKLLMGLQHVYCTPELRQEVFGILERLIPSKTDSNKGRPGMNLWKILVLGTIRLNCNWDYDKVKEMADNHIKLRQMLGHGIEDEDTTYALQTLRDNISLFTPEALDEINQVVVKAGHQLKGKKNAEDVPLHGKCDSFVVETDVHYPTDINLLFDAIRKMITLTALICASFSISGWRQSWHMIKKIKRLYRKAQKLKRSTSKDESKKTRREQLIVDAHQIYIDEACLLVERAQESIEQLSVKLWLSLSAQAALIEIENYIRHARRQIDQIRRRVIEGEKIGHAEKVFSIFEEHTEWINKGKAGVSQELGLRVCILHDQFGFILQHRVMEKETDDKVAEPMVKEAKSKYHNLSSCSFDKGFHTPFNQIELKKLLDKVILPKKGRLSAADKEVEYSDDFIHARHKHSAVESSINALENHGLDRCPDHGIYGFKRYVSMAVLGRNLQILGNMIQQNDLKRQNKREKRKKKGIQERDTASSSCVI